ncbi:MAG: TonB-dependent receptor [Tannerella sp.]|jgi:TonB-linked SusC/RagA family outer membrane protein|nr:TonB-dependent receptor [Tannerella sp.]
MKITAVLLLASAFCLFAENTHSQNARVSIHQRNVQLENVLEEIENQTDYLFVYNKNVDINRKVSVRESNKPLKNVLDNLFTGTDVSYAVEGSYIILSVGSKESSGGVSQQKRMIMGTITDASGEPIIGANVIEKGTPSNGVITDIDGRFSLSVQNEQGVLTISYIGYIPQEIALGSASNYNVILREDTQALDEVVIIGYGAVKKSDLTGSVGSIAVDKIQGVSIKSVDQMLQGRTPGLHMVQNSGMPGAGSTVRIRGGNSISGGNEPLYIIDGVPVYPSGDKLQTALNPLNTIPTADIESIEVLKDASSTAIYGSRGANGVIIVTTKRGQSGKTNVAFESYWGIENIAKDYDLLDAATFEKLSNESLVNSGGTAIYNESSPSSTTDWQKLTKNKNALLQNYQLTISGGNDKTTFLTSFNIYDQKGTIKATDMQKYAFRANLDHKISFSLHMGLNLTMTQVNNNRAGNDVLTTRLTTPPNLPIKQADGSYTFSDDAGVITFDNPVGVINDKVDKTARFRTLNNAFAEWTIIKGLTLKSSIGIDLNYSKRDAYNPITVYSGSLKDGIAIKESYNTLIWINENILTYTNTWDKHSFTGMVGYTQQASNYDVLKAGSYGYLNDILEMNNLESGTTYSKPESKLEKWALNSYLARVNYSFDSRYLLTASFRADGSSRFGSNNRWGYFPSAALAWRASEESFLKDNGIISNLKPRVSYGVTGNQDGIGVYPAYALLNTAGYPIGGNKETGYYPSQVANANLKWETTAQYDAGIDIGFFNNRLNFVADFYYKKTSDLLLKVTIPSSSGFTSGLKNIGEVENKGIELVVNATPVAGAFTWNTNFNITFNRNKVTDLGDVSFIYPTADQENNGIHLGRIIQVGEPLGNFYGYVFDGIFSTTDDIASSAQPTAKPGDIRFKDISGPDGVPDGQINDLDRTIIGCAQPKFFGGFVNDFSYKNFDLNVNVIFTYGNEIYNGTRVTLEDMQGATNMSATTINRWTPDNQNTDMPRMLRSKAVMRVSDQYVEKGSYLRFQNITLGYTVPRRALEFTKYVSSLRVYASLQNFFTITGYSGNNPEVSKYGQDDLGAGYDSFSYPVSKTVLFGLSVNF